MINVKPPLGRCSAVVKLATIVSVINALPPLPLKYIATPEFIVGLAKVLCCIVTTPEFAKSIASPPVAPVVLRANRLLTRRKLPVPLMLRPPPTPDALLLMKLLSVMVSAPFVDKPPPFDPDVLLITTTSCSVRGAPPRTRMPAPS